MGFIGVGTAYTSSSSATITMSPHASTQANDLMLAVLIRGGADDSPTNIPSGWDSTPVCEYKEATAQNISYIGVYKKIAGSSEGSGNWEWPGDSRKCHGIIYTCRDCFDSGDIVDVISNTGYTTSDTILRAASVSVSKNSSFGIFIGAVGAISSRTFTPPSGYTERYDNGDTDCDQWATIADNDSVSSGSTGNVDATISNAMTLKHAFLVVLNPESSSTFCLGLGGGM